MLRAYVTVGFEKVDEKDSTIARKVSRKFSVVIKVTGTFALKKMVKVPVMATKYTPSSMSALP